MTLLTQQPSSNGYKDMGPQSWQLKKDSRPFGFEATFFAGLYSESLLLERPEFESLSAPNLKACNCKDLGRTGPKIHLF